MEITSLQVCMDSSNWLQDTIHEETELDSPSDDQDIFTCSRTLTERKLRPQHDQPLNCPRCDSTHTKFCYYNNYSLSQPRYFCKSCRRYWTKGGTLRNIPVGGGCRKNNKKHSSSKKFSSNDTIHPQITNINQNPIPFPEMEFSHFNNNFVGNNFMVENNNIPTPFDFMMGGSSRNQDFIGNVDHLGMMNSNHGIAQNLNGGLFYGNINYEGQNTNIIDDVKPNPKILSLEWHDQQGCSTNVGNKESFGYFNGGSLLGSWTGLMNGYGSSTTNTLV